MLGTRQQIDTPLPFEPNKSWLTLDDRTVGGHFAAWFINLVLSRWGIDLAAELSRSPWEKLLADRPELFRDALLTAFDLDQDDPEGVLLQKAAKFCVRGELARAGKLMRGFIEERESRIKDKTEVEAGRTRQRVRAKKPRPNPFRELIEMIVSRRPDISEPELLERLMYEVANGVIESIENDKITWLNDKGEDKTSPVSGLKDMLYRAKKSLNKSQ